MCFNGRGKIREIWKRLALGVSGTSSMHGGLEHTTGFMMCALGRLAWLASRSFPHETGDHAKSLVVQSKMVPHGIAHIQILCQLIFIHTPVSTWTQEENQFLLAICKRFVIPIFYGLWRRKYAFFPLSFLIPAATVEDVKQWKGTGLRERHFLASPLFHAVTNAAISGYKMMLLLTYSYMCWIESLLLIHLWGIQWTGQKCMFCFSHMV